MSDYFNIGGTQVSPFELMTEKAKELANAIIVNTFYNASFIECRKDVATKRDIVIFDVQVDLAQVQVFDIKDVERIACVFTWQDESIPLIYALRSDFPSTPHMNLMKTELPRCLCIFDEDYEDMKISWSTPDMMFRISNWLTKTSIGELHNPDQPLELLLPLSNDNLVLPESWNANTIQFEIRESVNGRKTYIPVPFNKNSVGKMFLAATFQGRPLVHGIIRRMPETLFELSQITCEAGIDLIKELKQGCLQISDLGIENPKLYKMVEFIVILNLPKCRNVGEDAETFESRAFHITDNLLTLGVELGIWTDYDGSPGRNIPEIEKRCPGENIRLHALNVHMPFSRKIASFISGYSNHEAIKGVLVGAGALGSHLLNNLVRTGFGKWTVIDGDDLAPHNLARHTLNRDDVGKNKAISLASSMNRILKENRGVEGIPCNILRPANNGEKIRKVLNEAQIILDASTSIAVERYLARDIDSSARRISVFFNPSGTDLVMLIEDKDRKSTLDFLEMQYYRGICNQPTLHNHIRTEPGKIRYATSCRDISSRIPLDNVSLLSSICSAYLHQTIDNSEASINVWTLDPQNLTVNRNAFEVLTNIDCGEYEGWRIITDECLLKSVYNYRKQKLPNETGGILLGSYDMYRKIVYIIDTIPSPPDSKEWPSAYIRGNKGLQSKVQNIKDITQNKLEYVGEWHSHPDGYGITPSSDDQKFMQWVKDNMKPDGHPGLMLIVEESKYQFILD